MKKIFSGICAVLTLLLAAISWAEQPKVYVSGLSVTGAQNRDETKAALLTVLISRLNSEGSLIVDAPESADVVVSGSYVVFGKVFSVDAVAKNRSGGVVARQFVQGESQDELIPAIGKLAKALVADLAKSSPKPGNSAPAQLSASVQDKKSSDIIRTEKQTEAAAEIIRPEEVQKSAGSAWVSQRLPGVMNGIAVGRTTPEGEREIFVAGDRILRFYRKGKTLQQVAEISFEKSEKILSIDTADLDGDGSPEVYLTVLRGDMLVSQVWVATNGALKKVADNLPYFLRGIALEGKKKKIYAQEKNMDGDYYGDVYELVKTGSSYEFKNPIKLPKMGNIYNFNRINVSEGSSNFIIFHPDGYLMVVSPQGEQLWKSSDKFGGSELNFMRSQLASQNVSANFSRTIFLDQRIIVTAKGDVIVPQNAGFWVLGNSRSYSKNSLFAFSWNGAALEEKWHTRQSQNYLADFVYDDAARELLLLEVVQKDGLLGKGASAVLVKQVE